MTVKTPPQVSAALNSVLNEEHKKLPPKFEHCNVGPFNLPGVIVNTEQVTPEELVEMREWARDNGAYINTDSLFSWRKDQKRDWFTLRWS
jgi:hypothetical protein